MLNRPTDASAGADSEGADAGAPGRTAQVLGSDGPAGQAQGGPATRVAVPTDEAETIARLAAKEAELDTLREELDAANVRAKAAKDSLTELQAYVLKLESSHLALLRSRSWQMLEPVRGLVRRARGRKAPDPFVPRFAAATRERSLTDRLRKAWDKTDRVQRTFEKARSGFRDAGLAELRPLAASRSVNGATRQAASRSLILLLAESSDRAERAEALSLLDSAGGWGSSADTELDAALVRLTLLQSLGREEEAARLAAEPPAAAAGSADFLLLAASLSGVPPQRRLAMVSAAFQASAGLAIAAEDAARPIGLDNLRGADLRAPSTGGPLVSVVMPSHNAAGTIATSLRSILDQTWTELEVLVADDASTDGTAEVVADLAARDPRVRLIRLPENRGAYVARNSALAEAVGEFVTCQDSDDWSHPERLRRQVEDLLDKPHRVANVSRWARATDDLSFERRPYSSRSIHFNSSSIMFRRRPVLSRIGYWDSVRFGGDTEFWHRMRTAFSAAATAELPELLAIGRVREGSLSRASATAYLGGKTGARKAYQRRFGTWHETAAGQALHMPFPLAERPFGVPAIMTTGRPVTGHFDAVLISDFRHTGGTSASNYQELLAQTRAGIRTAVVQVDRYDFDVKRGIHPDIQALIDAGRVQELVHGDDVTADLAVVRFPPIFSSRQDFLPRVTPRNVRVVVNQPPRRIEGEQPFYSIETCKANIAAYLGQPGTWVPIGPAVRNALAADGEEGHLSAEDWFNIIDVDAWRVERDGWSADRPVIGRHGRDAPEKWMTRAEDLLAAYPEDGSIRVRIMGGASIPARIIGHLPEAWEVLEFNALPPYDFLAGLDFFVFFPHEKRIEAFGRTIIEAIASGCLAILPPAFEPLFGPAAIYASPQEVVPIIRRFRADRAAYLAHTAAAEALVRERFGFEQHVARLRRAMAGAEPGRAG